MRKRFQRAQTIFTIFGILIFVVAVAFHVPHQSHQSRHKHQKSVAAVTDTVSVDLIPAVTFCTYKLPEPHFSTAPVHSPDVVSTVMDSELQSRFTRPPPALPFRCA